MKNQKYSFEDKTKILKEHEESGESLQSYCRRKGISDSAVYRWRAELRNPKAQPEFIELGGAEYYELKAGSVSLKIPSRERIERIAEIFRSVAKQC